MKTLSLAIASALLIGGSSLAVAGAPVTAHGKQPFELMDKDGNGVVNELEYQAFQEWMQSRIAERRPRRPGDQPLSFQQIDANHDGGITQEELQTAQRERMLQHRTVARQLPSMPFGMMDANRDGQISKEEYDAFQERERSGPIKRVELPTFAEVDADGNGTLIPDEVIGWRRKAMAGQSTGAAHPLFLRADTDGDGKLSTTEYEAFRSGRPDASDEAKGFTKLDKNGDGTLGPDEFGAAYAPVMAPPAPHPVAPGAAAKPAQ